MSVFFFSLSSIGIGCGSVLSAAIACGINLTSRDLSPAEDSSFPVRAGGGSPSVSAAPGGGGRKLGRGGGRDLRLALVGPVVAAPEMDWRQAHRTATADPVMPSRHRLNSER